MCNELTDHTGLKNDSAEDVLIVAAHFVGLLTELTSMVRFNKIIKTLYNFQTVYDSFCKNLH